MRLATACSLFLSLAACDDGCTCDEGRTATAPAAVPVDAPDGWLWEATIRGAAGRLAELHALVPAPVNVAMPSTPGAIFERVAPHLPLAEAVPADATVHAIALSIEPIDAIVVAARVSPESDELLAGGLPLVIGAPHGGRWVGEAPGASSAAAMLLGDVLIAAGHPAALTRAAPYLASRVARGGTGARGSSDARIEGISVRFPEHFPGRGLRAMGNAAVERWAANARGAVRVERSRHEEAPAFGDPEALVALAEERARRWLAFLPDVGEIRAGAEPSPVGLVVRLDADVTDESPLARSLAAQRSVAPDRLLALPEGVAAAWITGRSEARGPSLVREAIERLGGARLDDGARARIAAADDAIAESETTIGAIGASGGSAWLAVATTPSLDAELLREALGAGFVRDVAGALLGCEGPVAPSAFREDVTAHIASLCVQPRARSTDDAPRGPATPELVSASTDGATLVAIARSPREPGAASFGDIAARAAQRLAGQSAAGDAGSSPDLARTVGALDDEALAAGLLVPSRIFAAAGLLPPFARAVEHGGREAPVGWSLSRTEGGLRVTIVATRDGLADLAGVLAPFLSD